MNRKHVIRQAECISKGGGCGDLDDREGILRDDGGAALHGQEHRAQVIKQNRVDDGVEGRNGLRIHEGSRGQNRRADSAVLIEDIPTELLGNRLNELRSRYVQALGHCIQIDVTGATRG